MKTEKIVDNPENHGWELIGGKWIWASGRNTGHITDGDLNGETTVWKDNQSSWVPNPRLVFNDGGYAHFTSPVKSDDRFHVSGGGGMTRTPTGGLNLYTENNSGSIVLDENGNVGIGTNAPSGKLEVDGDGVAQFTSIDFDGTRDSFINLSSSNTADSGVAISLRSRNQANQWTTSTICAKGDSFVFGHQTVNSSLGPGAYSVTPRLTIDSSGNATFSGELNVRESGSGVEDRAMLRVKLGSSTFGGSFFHASKTDSWYPQDAVCLFNFDDGPLAFGTSNKTRLTLDASGDATFSGDLIQIGPAGANHKFVIEGVYAWNTGIDNAGYYIQNDGGSIRALNIAPNTGDATFSGTVDAAGFTVNGVPISGGGGLPDGGYTYGWNITAADFIATSDERLKDNITTVPVGLIDSLKGREWEWKESGEKGSGVVAQELEQVLPHLVHEDDEGMKSVSYNGLVAYLIEEVKALKAEVEALKS